MHFKSISTALLSALLLTLVCGQFAQVARRFNGVQGLAIRGRKTSAFAIKFCSRSVPKKGRRDIEQRVLEIRAPAAHDNVNMGELKSRTATEPGLYSEYFGTCPGYVVTGTPTSGGATRFLFHQSLGSGITFAQFATAVRSSGMKNLRGTMLTVDTRASNPELKDHELVYEAKESEKDYKGLLMEFTVLCGQGKTDRRYHPYGSTATMSVSNANYVTCIDTKGERCST